MHATVEVCSSTLYFSLDVIVEVCNSALGVSIIDDETANASIP
jgi:hypothetical protein